jgi:signal transduction histidine kinase
LDRLRVIRTSTFQLTLLYATLFALSITIVAGFLYWSTIGYMQRQTDATIEAEVIGLAEQYRSLRLPGLVRVIRERIEDDPSSGALYLFADRNYKPLAGNLDRWPELASRADGWYSFQYRTRGSDVPARARVFALPEGLVLLVGREIADLDRTTSIFRNALAWGGGIAFVLSLLGGVLMSAGVLRRVEQVNQTTRQIIAGDLSGRVQTRGTGDEFDELAENFNRMLEEIERLLESVRHVGDGIAHDLRTPLTRLRNTLEEVSRLDDLLEARRRIEDAIADADGLLRTFGALLRIAHIESGSYAADLQCVSMDILVEDAVELYQALAEERGVELAAHCAEGGAVWGDRDLLFQLLANLIDNAVKYTPDGGRIDVSLDEADDGVTLCVADSGPGIPAALRDRVRDRFYRVDSSRHAPGNGLGLSLVQAVADYHGATLTLHDNHPGLKAEVRFAAASSR